VLVNGCPYDHACVRTRMCARVCLCVCVCVQIYFKRLPSPTAGGSSSNAATGNRRLGAGHNTPDTLSVATSALKAANLPASPIREGDQRSAGNSNASASVTAAEVRAWVVERTST